MNEVSTARAIVQESWPHTVNVAVHVLCATLALALGLIQLIRTKGDAGHVARGSLFVRLLWVAVATAAAGLMIFRFGAFLGVITLLAGYWNYSGARALKIRSTGPTLRDALVSIGGLAAAAMFVLYIRSVPFPWAPTVIYSTLATLAVVASYDLARFAFPSGGFSRSPCTSTSSR